MGSLSSITTTYSPQPMSSRSETIPEMISGLRSAFLAVDFSRVEANLVAREEALKEKLEAKNRKIRMIEKEYQILKGALEDKVKEMELLEENYKLDKLEILNRDSQISELKESNSRLLDERSQYEKTVLQLQRKNCDLEGSKSRAEEEVERYRGKFQELGDRTLMLEKDLLLKSEEAEKYREKFWELEQRTLMLEKDLLSKSVEHPSLTGISMNELGEKDASENNKLCEKIDNEKAEACTCLSETAENINLELNEQNANAKTSASACKRALPEDIVDDHAPTDIRSVKKHKGPFQLKEHFPSISSISSGSSDSDDDTDYLLDVPSLPATFLRGKRVNAGQGKWVTTSQREQKDHEQ